MHHIDIVLNDWQQHLQKRVALVVVIGDELLVKSTVDDTIYADMAETELAQIAGTASRDELMNSFACEFGSSHLFALDPHDDDACPFKTRDALPIDFEAVEVSSAGEQPHPHDDVLDLCG